MGTLRNILRRCKQSERGASLVEYALLVALIAIVCLSAVVFFGSNVSTKMSRNGSAIGAAGGP